jgi:UPF0755 protein
MKILRIFIGIAVLAGIGLGGVAWQLGLFRVPGEPVVIVVERGSNFLQLAHQLKEHGVIQNDRMLRWYINFWGRGKRLQRGEFELYQNMSIPGVVNALTNGKPIEHKFTVPEGYNIFQIAELLEEKGLGKRNLFLKAAHSKEVTKYIPTASEESHPRSIEGYIFPDTYLIQKIFSEEEIAEIMVARFREVYAKLKDSIAASPVVQELHLTPHQVITLASIVEKETGAASERPMIATVFLNRLRKHMRLQTDPTVIYGVWERDGMFSGNIHRRDLTTPTDYNTYVINGLPPGPIASPGQQAIQAVLNPQEHDYLFFVSKNDGTHEFSKDFRSHAKAVQALQINSSARQGKSWRDLPKERRAN